MKRTTDSDNPILHICAPASPVGEDLDCLGINSWDDLQAAVRKVVSSTWQITGQPGLIWAPFQPDHAGRTDDADRAADLQAAMADDRVRAIVALRGGAWLLRILERIDFSVLDRRRNALYLIGFSEWTCLSLVAAQHRRAICVHHTSPLYMLPTNPNKPLSQPQKQARWHQIWTSIRKIITRTDPARPLTGRLVTSHNLRDQAIRLLGGNLTLVAAMAGTPYQPCASAPGAWLALEDINETIGRIDRKFTQMRLAGMFDGVCGVLLGGFHSDGHNATRAVATLLRAHLPPKTPIIAAANFGHFWPAAPFPVNRPLRLLTNPRGTVEFQTNWSDL